MLVLSRKTDETIIIGDSIKIKVIKVKGNTIRLGIEAPEDVKILRGELAPYGVGSDRDIVSAEGSPSKSSKSRFANSAPTVEFETTLEDAASLPNPFVVAHAS